MSNTDSLLAAAKKVASISGLQWAEVQPYYKNLQGKSGYEQNGWLPKSQGRTIWSAHPNYITRLLIALAGTTNPTEACDVVSWAQELTPNGREYWMTERPSAGNPYVIESAFFPYLIDPDTASDLINIEIQPDNRTIIFHIKSGDPLVYRPNPSADKGRNDAPKPFAGIKRRGLIEGIVFVYLARTVNWRRADEAPLVVSQKDASDDE